MKHSFFVLSVLLSGCATSIDVPFNRFESPEIQNNLKLKLDAGTQKQVSVLLSTDYTLFPPNTTQPSLGKDTEATASIGLGLLDYFEIGFRVPTELTAKAQILGAHRSEAKAGNFSLTAILGVSKGGKKASGQALFSSSTYDIDINQSYNDFGFIVGYRFIDQILLYGGYNRIACMFDGTYARNSTRTNLSGSMDVDVGHLGLEVSFSPSFSLKLEGTTGRLDYNHAQSKTLYGLGGVVSFYQL